KALELLADLLEKNPRSTEAIRSGLQEILASNPPDEMLRRFSKAAYKNTTGRKFALHYIGGVLGSQSGKQHLAADHFQRAIDAKSDFYPAYEALLDLHLDAGREEEVERLLDRLQKQAPEGHYYFYILGRARLGQARPDQAVEALQTARDKDPSHLPTLLKLAEAYRLAGSQSNSETVAKIFRRRSTEVLRKALKLAPKDIRAYRTLFNEYVRRREFDNAYDITAKLTRQLPSHPDGRIMAAEANILSGQHQKARLLIDRLRKEFPQKVEIQLLEIRADVSRYSGVLPKAVLDRSIDRINKLLRQHPNNIRARRMLAQLLSRPVPGKYADAAIIWSRLYEQSDKDIDIGQAFAAALLRAKQYAFAQKLIEELLHRAPGNRNLRILLIEAFTKLNKTRDVLQKVKAWWSKDKDNTKWFNLLLDLYGKSERFDEAIVLLDKLAQDPESQLSSKFLQLNKLEMLLQAKRYDQAVQIAMRNKNYAWTVRIAYTLIEAKQFQKVLSLLEKQWAETDDPNVRELLERLKLMAYVQAGQLDKALELTEKQLKPAPEALKPRLALVSVLIEEEKYDAAIQQINRWIEELAHTAPPRPDGAEKTLAWLRKSQIGLLIQTKR
ncbi:MAG: tetratricopeptide repeat protein, partial [Candidatus Hydrogenedentes bacterium]|nr:tetratricopeptide repeat protein [Candidatus Hydrogenedentota bacterium]